MAEEGRMIDTLLDIQSALERAPLAEFWQPTPRLGFHDIIARLPG